MQQGQEVMELRADAAGTGSDQQVPRHKGLPRPSCAFIRYTLFIYLFIPVYATKTLRHLG